MFSIISTNCRIVGDELEKAEEKLRNYDQVMKIKDVDDVLLFFTNEFQWQMFPKSIISNTNSS